MAIQNATSTSSIDPNSGFCPKTGTYHSLRPLAPLPPPSAPLSVTDYIFSHLASHPPPATATALVDVSTSRGVAYPELIRRVRSLSSSLRSRLGLSRGDCALIISPNSLDIPVLYLSLFSIGVAVSPCNPSSTAPEILHLIQLSRPSIAFAMSKTASKVPSPPLGTVLIDSPEVESLMRVVVPAGDPDQIDVSQSDTAAILYSSGTTTGKVKAVALTHRNLTSMVAGSYAVRAARASTAVALCTVPYFHAFGFTYCVRSVAMGETLVCMGRFRMEEMGRAIERFRVSHTAVAPPVVIAMVKGGSVMEGYDFSSLEVVVCGGAPLPATVVARFKDRFPNVQLAQGYGLTESTGRAFGTVGPKESAVVGATGKLVPDCEAKIIDPDTGAFLPPCKVGELWVRGSSIMKGYVGDEQATRAIVDTEGWLRTGDLCYIDGQGFLFFVDRIKEIIKYKGYQVAPGELEHLLQSHPDVVDAAVAPYPDEEAGQIPMAFIVRRPGSAVDEPSIKAFVAQMVAPYKKIRHVMFIDSIPKNAAGKVLRRELSKLASLGGASKI
ncbi:4-coumarate--CoA ligase-like 9 [Rhodamnia argentea]|uniref:4-coumarate--CoA ligase-like 9 n=1 Tax=Rhodamnia argentea TaxID=178133 RepID=A0A8B8Q4D2_9MYRT|nr:4-coumarate--CoA ligase-like 9 [Rhodamnia argentea]